MGRSAKSVIGIPNSITLKDAQTQPVASKVTLDQNSRVSRSVAFPPLIPDCVLWFPRDTNSMQGISAHTRGLW
jgi:hypothetical protein